MKINEPVREAINKAIDYYGNISRLAKAIGIAHSTILFWLDGKTTTISGKLWIEKVRPVIGQFIDPSYAASINPYPNMLLEPIPAYNASSSDKKKEAPPKSVPVITYEQLMEYDPTLESVETFARTVSTAKTTFATPSRDGFFALSVNPGTPFSRYFLPTAYLLVASNEYANNEDVVIARLRSEEKVLICVYNREGDQITLSPLPGCEHEKSYSWDLRKSPGYLFWIYPLIECSHKFRD